MPSLFNVIKNTSVISTGSKEINTQYIAPKYKNSYERSLKEKNAKDFIESYEVLAKTILEKARHESEQILKNSHEKAKSIEEDAYIKGLNLGKEDGYLQGKIEADKYYEDIKNKANKEIESMFFNAKDQYVNYLEEKEECIKDLIIHITQQVLLKELQNYDVITNMVINAIETAKDSKNIIIKTKNNYISHIKDKVEKWKDESAFNGKVFIIKDDSIDDGKAIIQKENGKIVVDILNALQEIHKIVKEK